MGEAAELPLDVLVIEYINQDGLFVEEIHEIEVQVPSLSLEAITDFVLQW